MKNKITSVKRISAKRRVLEMIPDVAELEKRIEDLIESEALTQVPKKPHTIASLVREKGQIRGELGSLRQALWMLHEKMRHAVLGLLCCFLLWSCAQAPRAGCPAGFVQAPGFCVMQYEARALGAGGELGGSDLTVWQSTQVRLDRDLFTPASRPDGYPWVNVTRDEARAECQALGGGFDLISNGQWQTIAMDVTEQAGNWSGGQVDQGCLFQGVTGDPNECGYSGHVLEAGPYAGQPWIDFGSDRDPRAKLVLSTGAEVWDMSGNVWEWVRENDPMLGRWGPNRYMGAPGYSDELRGIAGPGRDFSCSALNYWCGFGFGRIDYTGPTIMRGGMTTFDNDEPWSVGIFAADNDDPLTSANGAVGFRCVYQQ